LHNFFDNVLQRGEIIMVDIEHIGFKTCQILLNCKDTMELDNAITIINNFYRIYREHLLVLDEIKTYRNMGLDARLVKTGGP